MIVGLTQRVFYHNGQSYDATDRDWYKFFSNHQCAPIRNDTMQNFEAIADKLDALIITGGNDPIERRIVETSLARHMLLLGKPIIGVCHGAYLLTELLDGKVKSIEGHHNTEHEVYTNEGVWIVNSFHTFRITEEPAGSNVLAMDKDGNIESWIKDNMAAIVWHPERMEKPYVPSPIAKLLSNEDK